MAGIENGAVSRIPMTGTDSGEIVLKVTWFMRPGPGGVAKGRSWGARAPLFLTHQDIL